MSEESNKTEMPNTETHKKFGVIAAGIVSVLLSIYFICKVNAFFEKIEKLSSDAIWASVIVILIIALLLTFLIWIVFKIAESMWD